MTEYTKDDINADNRRFTKERREMAAKVRHLFAKDTEVSYLYRGKLYQGTVTRLNDVTANVKLKLANGTSTHKVDLTKLYDQMHERGEVAAVAGYRKVKAAVSNFDVRRGKGSSE